MTLSRLAILALGAALLGAPVAARAEPAPAKPVQTALMETEKPKVDAAAAASPTDAVKPLKKKKRKAKAAPIVEDVSMAPVHKELRSDDTQRLPGLFDALFGGPVRPQLLPETQERDEMLREREQSPKAKKFRVKAEFVPQSVPFSGYPRGTIVIDTQTKFLYLVEGRGTARRYAIAVGREGLLFTGQAKVGDKQEWPRWIPTKEMQQREPKHYGQYKDGMDGGPDNPLGARAIYLYQGKSDTHIRIHGTNQPWSIGSAASNGCFRMINEHVMDLYGRVKIGTNVVVL